MFGYMRGNISLVGTLTTRHRASGDASAPVHRGPLRGHRDDVELAQCHKRMEVGHRTGRLKTGQRNALGIVFGCNPEFAAQLRSF